MKELRNILRVQRQSISTSDRIKYSKRLLTQVQKIAHLQNGKKIAIYLENDGEISTQYIQNLLKAKNIDVYLPTLSGEKLKFAKINNKFKKNRFRIKEPIFSTILDAKKMNIIFMPLVGFDKNKNRIGMGGGFYDNTLSFKKQQKYYKSPKLYGLAFDCQKVDKLAAQPWDIPLDAVITPSKIYQ